MKVGAYITILILVGFILLQWKCNADADKTAKVVAAAVVDSVKKEHARIIDSINAAIAKKDRAYDSTIAIKDSTIQAMAATQDKRDSTFGQRVASLTFSVNKYKAAAEKKDTAAAYTICNDIIGQLQDAGVQIEGLKLIRDSLQAALYERIRVGDSTHNSDKIMISSLTSTIQRGFKSNEGCLTDQVQLQSKVSSKDKELWITRAVAAVLGLIIVIKK